MFLTTAINAAEVEDLAGRKIEVPAQIDKIVGVGPGALRLVVYLEAEDKVVGIEEFERRSQKRPYILAKAELLELPVIGPQFGGDAELIAAQNPDLIIASYLSSAELSSLQNKTKIPVVSINNGSPGSMTEEDFKAALNNNDLDCRALINHNPDKVLGRKKAGRASNTLELKEDNLHPPQRRSSKINSCFLWNDDRRCVGSWWDWYDSCICVYCCRS